ncbi:hypothetical protein [Streptomyces beigongshangae]|nr:hypothetical protein [Streptomyces sp. REN17]
MIKMAENVGKGSWIPEGMEIPIFIGSIVAVVILGLIGKFIGNRMKK